MNNIVKITKWGNSYGVRIPVAVLRKAEMEMNDLVYIETDRAGFVSITKKPALKKGTIEYLFKDYEGEKFDTALIDLGDAVGEEKW